jgi:hypothetical protein
MSKFLVLAASIITGFVGVAIILAIVDLYLAGHNITPLGNRRLLDVGAMGVHLSFADGLALVGATMVAAYAWITWARAR